MSGTQMCRGLRFLIDTNVIIPLELARPRDIEELTPHAAEMIRLAAQGGHFVYVHPASDQDISRDPDKDRRDLRRVLLRKYLPLPEPPPLSARMTDIVGQADPGTNDWVDHVLLSAVVADAVDFLVTEDHRLQSKARRLGLGDRVVAISEAIDVLRSLAETIPTPPPAVRSVVAHALDSADPIFDSLREDYPGFDDWLRKCKLEHRQTWVIDGAIGRLAGVCIVKTEDDPPKSLSGKAMKICTLKVCDEFSGFRYGELLLKAVFEHAFGNDYDWLYLTVFPKHERLLAVAEDFGFQALDEPVRTGELVLAKPLSPDLEEKHPILPVDYHIRYGPKFFRTDVAWYVVPILPEYASVLFPETERQRQLFPGKLAFGNSVRKAYLCHSPIRSLNPGDVLVFYRSARDQGALALGVVEDTLVSSSAEEVARYVGKRTVYSLDAIRKMCQRDVLAVLFRQARVFKPVIPARQLAEEGVFMRPPQSITSLTGEGLTWFLTKLNE